MSGAGTATGRQGEIPGLALPYAERPRSGRWWGSKGRLQHGIGG